MASNQHNREQSPESSRSMPAQGENAIEAEHLVRQVENRNGAMKTSQYQVVELDWIGGVFRKQGHEGSGFLLFLIPSKSLGMSNACKLACCRRS